jgi:hypothetical protein
VGARVVLVERLLTAAFGPSRSKRFANAVAEAQSGPGEYSEIEPGRYRVSFVLGEDATVYSGLARLLERVRNWSATEVYDEADWGDLPRTTTEINVTRAAGGQACA